MKRFFFFPLLLLAACTGSRREAVFPQRALVQSAETRIDGFGTPVRFGGYGSSMAFDPADTSFYLLTDRGPNVDGPTAESKVFVCPGFNPHLAKFRLRGDTLFHVKTIPLTDADGRLFSGLPNEAGDGMTGETAYDARKRLIRSDGRRGIDPEGLALAPDGSFWISDEYGPFLLHFNREGRLLDEFSPFNGRLPGYYAKRRPNRGMEGLTISPDGTILYGIMQSPLYHPDSSTKDRSRQIRIIALDLRQGTTREYIYLTEHPANVVSEIAYRNGTRLLVLERDTAFPLAGQGFKKIYEIDLAEASDIAGHDGGKPAESLSAAELERTGIVPVRKKPFCDLLAERPDYAADKPEGIALIGDSILCVVNDDDFGITAPERPDGSFIAKFRKNNRPDRNEMIFIRTTTARKKSF